MSTHKISSTDDNVGAGDASTNNALITGYQQENERLYLKTKGSLHVITIYSSSRGYLSLRFCPFIIA